MSWDNDGYGDDYYLNDDDDMYVVEDEEDEEYIADNLQDEMDYELYEQERENTDSDDFPDTFEEWKIMKQQEKWNMEDEMDDPDMTDEFEE